MRPELRSSIVAVGHAYLTQAVDKPIQLDPTLAAAAGAPLPQNSAVRQLDEGQYPGGEFFNTQVAFYVIGVQSSHCLCIGWLS
eukprot:SAG11_NODE_1250_length_5389_cov_12.806994_7_plen_83_part_00